MHGTNLERVTRLVHNVLKNPQFLPDYLFANCVGKSPLDLELPWFSYTGINFLTTFLKPHMSLFEYGSGGSTIFFARRVRSVTSTEESLFWVTKVETRLNQLSLDNVQLQHRPFDSGIVGDITTSDYVHSIPDEGFDVIVVDGTEPFFPLP